MKTTIVIVILLALAACAHGSRRHKDYMSSRRFTVIQLSENAFQISYRGDGFSHAEHVQQLVLQKSGQVALEHGFPYFVIVDSQNRDRTSSFTTPTQSYTTANANIYGNSIYGQAQTTTYGGQTFVIHKPSSMNTIMGLKEKPDGFAYESAMVAPLPR